MTSDLAKKSRWAAEAIGPTNTVLRQAVRGLVDLPVDVTPGARQVAQLAGWRCAQDYALGPVTEAIEELSKLENWSGGFLVTDSTNFDWRTCPFRRYASFEDFWRTEMEPTWRAWDELARRMLTKFPPDYEGNEQAAIRESRDQQG